MNLKIFATVHSLMNYTTLIDSCQTHLPVQRASNIELIRRSDTGVVIDSEPQPSRTLLSWLPMFKPAVLTPTKPLVYFKYNTVLIPKL